MATFTEFSYTIENETSSNVFTSFADPTTLTSENCSDLIQSIETHDTKNIKKLFLKLTENQKKFFISNLISIFGSSFLRKLNFTLESINHNDFDYKVNINRERKPKTVATEKQLESKPTINLERSFTKLPRIVESSRNSKAPSRRESVALNNSRKNSVIHSSHLSESSNPPTSANRVRHRPKSYDIDKFTLSKSLDIIDTPWSLKQVTLRGTFDPKLVENTNKLVEKLKVLFQEKYGSKLSSMFVDLHEGEEKPKKEDSLESAPPSREKGRRKRSNSILQNDFKESLSRFSMGRADSRSRSRSRRTSAANDSFSRRSSNRKIAPEDLKNIYMKKLQNNYYDRKLWNTLINSNTSNPSGYNLFVEKNTREYDKDFSILTQSDWTESKFAKHMSLYSNLMPSINRHHSENFRSSVNSSKSSIRELNRSQLTTYQKSVTKRNKEIRVKYLKTIMTLISIIKKWSNLEKQNFVLFLLENISKTNVQFLRDTVKNKAKPVNPNINHVPDNVLLNIFSYLDVKTLDNASNVCSRWYFLAKTPELWLFKCKKIGEIENINQIVNLINDLSKNNEIDWRQAFIQLQEFINSESVRNLKVKYFQNLKINSKAVKPTKITFKSDNELPYQKRRMSRRLSKFSKKSEGNLYDAYNASDKFCRFKVF